jgi:hypothetical protein
MIDIDQYLHLGRVVGLGIYRSISHAVTCWGLNGTLPHTVTVMATYAANFNLDGQV